MICPCFMLPPLPTKELADALQSPKVKEHARRESERMFGKRKGHPFLAHPRKVIDEILFPTYGAADYLALKKQKHYFRAVIWVYSCSILALLCAALSVSFVRFIGVLLVVEAVLMALVLGWVVMARCRQWHRRWIDFRFFAEQLRSAIFTHVAGLPVPDLVIKGPAIHKWPEDDWTVQSYNALIGGIPARPEATLAAAPTRTSADQDAIREFVNEVWVIEQQKYHEGKATSSRQKERRWELLAIVAFAIGFLCVVLLLCHVPYAALHNVCKLGTLFLPALGIAFVAYRSHREYERLAERSDSMAPQLAELSRRLTPPCAPDQVEPAVEEMRNLMLEETKDWRALIKFTDVKPL